jgi:isoleucyl-tRNA synthetase
VLDILFQALVRYAAPILCFTAEEVWGTRYPDGGSVHLLEWPTVEANWSNDDLRMKWERLRELRTQLTGKIEPLRREKVIGSSLEADVTALAYQPNDAALLRSVNFAEIAITAPIKVAEEEVLDTAQTVAFEVAKTELEKCGRCWRHLPEVAEDGALCDRCTEVVG